jgi:hypothetical protein
VTDSPDQAVADRPRGIQRSAFGFERKGLWATVAVAAVVLFYAAGLPLIDALISPSGTLASPGTTVLLAPPARGSSTGAVTPAGVGTTVRIVPASGWRIPAADSGSGTLTLERDAITVRVTVRSSDATADDIERSIERDIQRQNVDVVFHTPQTFMTDQGLAGVAASFVSTRTEGSVFAFSRSGTVVSARAVGPQGALQGATAREVFEMVRSLRFT